MKQFVKQIMLRAHPIDVEALQRLSVAWGVSQSDVLRLLIRDADRRLQSGISALPIPILQREAKGGRAV